MNFNDLLKNKYVLYGLLFLSVTNVAGLISIGDFNSLAFMIAVGLLTSYFTKNMVVVLATALIATNVVYMRNRYVEGFENEDDEETSDIEPKKNKEEKKVESMKNKTKGKKTNPGKAKDAMNPKGKEGESKKAKKDGFAQRNVPSSSPAPASESEEDEEIGHRVDYAATMEQAYSNLQNMLGDGGMAQLSKDTKELIGQQKNLMKTLDDMQPMMKMAKDTMSGLNLDSMTKSLQNMSSMIGGLKLGK
jgi:hypothetical protein